MNLLRLPRRLREQARYHREMRANVGASLLAMALDEAMHHLQATD